MGGSHLGLFQGKLCPCRFPCPAWHLQRRGVREEVQHRLTGDHRGAREERLIPQHRCLAGRAGCLLGQGPDFLGSFPLGGGFPLPVPPRACQRAAPQPWLPGWSLPALGWSSGAQCGPPLRGDVRGRRTPLAALRHRKISVGWEGRHGRKLSRIPRCSSQSLPSSNCDFPVSGCTSLLQSVRGVSPLPEGRLAVPSPQRGDGAPASRGRAGSPPAPAASTSHGCWIGAGGLEPKGSRGLSRDSGTTSLQDQRGV